MIIKRMFDRHKYIIIVFLLNFIIALLSFVGIMIKNDGLFTLWRDYNEQQIPVMMLMNDSIKSGNVWWNWNIDLGSDFIGAMSVCSVASPFFWLTLLFPKNAYFYLGSWLFMIKYTVAGITSYIYLARFVKEKKYAVIGSVLYAFSGFQATNLVFNTFHDVVALFPLMLIGIEKITEEKKKGFLAVAVLLNAITYYYFFVQEVIFITIYFVAKNGIKKWREIRDCFIEGIIGTAMAGFVLVPALSLMFGNPRIGSRLGFSEWFNVGTRYMLQLARAFCFPAEMMGTPSCIYQGDWSSWSAYLPMIGISLVIAYILKKKNDWVCRLIITMWIFCCIPLLNSVFNLFLSSNYHRWYFMLVLIMCLASIRVMEEREQYHAGRVVSLILILMCVMIAVFPWWHENKFELIYYPKNFYVLSIVGIAGVAFTLIIFTFIRKERIYFASLVLLTSVFSIVTTGYMCVSYQNNAEQTPQDYYSSIKLNQNIKMPDERYRFLTHDNAVTMTVPISGTGSFYSSVNGSIFDFWKALGKERSVRTPDAPYGTEELLSVKYEISMGKRETGKLIQQIESDGRSIYIYERENAVPIGSVYHTYILKSEYDSMEAEKGSLIMLQTLVIPDEEEIYVKDCLSHCENIEELPLEELILEREAESSEKLTRNKKGFKAYISCGEKGYAYFSVPFSQNWHVYVNGKSVDIIDTNGMMAIPVGEGDNEIVFSYMSKEFLAGSILSLFAVCIFCLYIGIIPFKKFSKVI